MKLSCMKLDNKFAANIVKFIIYFFTVKLLTLLKPWKKKIILNQFPHKLA